MITTTLEQSKRLKELGAPQDTERFWGPSYYLHSSPPGWEEKLEWNGEFRLEPNPKTIYSTGEEAFKPWYRELSKIRGTELYAAYTLQELIEWLGDDFWELHRYPGLELKYTAVRKPGGKHSGGHKTALEAVYHLAVAVKEAK